MPETWSLSDKESTGCVTFFDCFVVKILPAQMPYTFVLALTTIPFAK